MLTELQKRNILLALEIYGCCDNCKYHQLELDRSCKVQGCEENRNKLLTKIEECLK